MIIILVLTVIVRVARQHAPGFEGADGASRAHLIYNVFHCCYYHYTNY